MTHTLDKIVEIAQDTTVSLEDRANSLINIGITELGLELGIISQVLGQDYTVLYSNNSDLVGEQFKLGVTYCHITLSMVQSRILAVKQFSVSEYFRHPAYKSFNLETYIGSPVMLNARPFGTINFTKSETRTTEFTDADKQLVQWLSIGTGHIVRQLQAKEQIMPTI